MKDFFKRGMLLSVMAMFMALVTIDLAGAEGLMNRNAGPSNLEEQQLDEDPPVALRDAAPAHAEYRDESEEQQSEDHGLEHLPEERGRVEDRSEGEVDESVDVPGLEHHGEYTDQHHEGRHMGIDEELDRGIMPAGSSVP